MADLKVQEADGGVVFTAKIIPGSSGRTRISGLYNGMLKIKVSAAPEKGKANQNLVKFLADKLEVKKNDITIISGQTNPVKQIRITGISTDNLLRKLNLD